MKQRKEHLIAFRVTDSEKKELSKITKHYNTNFTDLFRAFVVSSIEEFKAKKQTKGLKDAKN